MFESFWPQLASIPHIGPPLALAWGTYLGVLAVWIIWDKREPVATLSWLLALAALPVVGLAIYYLFGPMRIRRQRIRRARARAALAAPTVHEEGANLAEVQVARLARRTTGLLPKVPRKSSFMGRSGGTLPNHRLKRERSTVSRMLGPKCRVLSRKAPWRAIR